MSMSPVQTHENLFHFSDRPSDVDTHKSSISPSCLFVWFEDSRKGGFHQELVCCIPGQRQFSPANHLNFPPFCQEWCHLNSLALHLNFSLKVNAALIFPMLFISSWAAPWMSSSEAIPVGHMRSACSDDDDAGHHQPHWRQPHWHHCHHLHLPSAHLVEVKAVNVIIKGSPSPPLKVAQLFFQYWHLQTKIQNNSITSPLTTFLFKTSPAWHCWRRCRGSGRWPSPPWSQSRTGPSITIAMCIFEMIRLIGLWTN